MKKTTYSMGLGFFSLLIVSGVFTGLLSPTFIYSLSLLFGYAAARYGNFGYLGPGLGLMIFGSLIIFGPSVSLIEVALLTIYGIVMGLSFFRRSTPEMIFLPSLAMLFGVMLTMFYLQKNLLGIDGLEALIEGYMSQIQIRIPDAQFLMDLRATMKEYSLSIVFLVALIFNLFICWVFSKMLDFRGLKKTGRFVFEYFRLRGLGIVEIIQLYAVAILGSFITKMPMQTALTSLSLVLLSLFYVQGLSLLVFGMKSRGKGKFLVGVMVFFSLTMPFVQFFLAFIGLLEQKKDFRKLENIA
ncbi:MAG: DUF2232 domain-containing protein [Tissierellia bacterium]|nr:DUF2232 domain-containing protein [Tissierellia bacterium]